MQSHFTEKLWPREGSRDYSIWCPNLCSSTFADFTLGEAGHCVTAHSAMRMGEVYKEKERKKDWRDDSELRNVLLLQRARTQFPTPVLGSSPQPVTPAPGIWCLWPSLGRCTQVYIFPYKYTYIYIHNLKNKINLLKEIKTKAKSRERNLWVFYPDKFPNDPHLTSTMFDFTYMIHLKQKSFRWA